jgi:hypothetical protein
VRRNQQVESGKTVMSVGDPGGKEGLSVIAFLPGGERPRLRPGQALHLTLPGYRGARISSSLYAVSADVLGAAEAKTKFLGDRLGDLQIAGTVVVVEGHIDSVQFEADGEKYDLHDGMIGLAEVRLASHSVLETLIPGLQ